MEKSIRPFLLGKGRVLFHLFWNEKKATDIGTKEGGKPIGTKKGDKNIGKDRKNRCFQYFSKKKKKNVDKIIRHIVIYRSCLENRREHNCGCSSMVECQPSKLNTWVRFPSPACCPDSSVGRAEDWKSSCHWFDSGSGHCARVVEWYYVSLPRRRSRVRFPSRALRFLIRLVHTLHPEKRIWRL